MVIQPFNWFAGWGMALAGVVSGALLGMWFHRDDFLGGYTSFRRRILRLGHIALVALGAINVLYSYSPPPCTGGAAAASATAASALFVVGGISMPLVCFLTAWRQSLRRLFPIPVAALVAAIICVLVGGPS
jgi:hypothetical protein